MPETLDGPNLHPFEEVFVADETSPKG